VALEGNEARVVIPAGALPADTQITIEQLGTGGMPDRSSLASDVYDFGPDGIQFLQPVTLSIALEKTVPQGKTPVLAVLENNAWVTVPGSALANGFVTAQVTHFTRYVIRFIEESTVIASDCSSFEFSACGGDMVGTWKIRDVCFEQQLGHNPYAAYPACQSTVYGVTMDWTGTWIFQRDGTATVRDYGYTSWLDVRLTDACINAVFAGAAPATWCQELSDASEDLNCTYASGACSCTSPAETRTLPEQSGTWSTSGSTLTMGRQGDTDSSSQLYCVSGNTAVVQFQMEGVPAYMIFERQ